MPMYITYAKYSHSGVKGMIDKPTDRTGAIKALIAYSDEAGRLYRLKPAGDSDDPGHLVRRALVSTLSSGQLAGSSSSL